MDQSAERLFKFRAWDPEGKEFISAGIVENQRVPVAPTEHGFALQTKFVLNQWTGLCDRNGVEIYEGDILDGHSDGHAKVVWSNENGGWECIFPDEGNIGIAEMCTWFGNNAIVIGNIYENPVLFQYLKTTR